MTIVTAQMSVSMDGFYAGPEHTSMQPWFEGPEAAGFFRVTRWVTTNTGARNGGSSPQGTSPPSAMRRPIT